MNSLDALVDIVAEITAKDEKSAALMKQINAAQGDETKLALLENQKALVDGTAIGQLVSDRQALMALLALVNNRQELTRLQAGQANAAGAVDGSYGFLAEGSGFKKAQFSLAKSEAEYGAFEKFSDRIGGWMQSAAQWMRGHPEQAQTATQVGYGATAASAAAVSAKAVSGGGSGFWSNWGSKLLGSKAGLPIPQTVPIWKNMPPNTASTAKPPPSRAARCVFAVQSVRQCRSDSKSMSANRCI